MRLFAIDSEIVNPKIKEVIRKMKYEYKRMNEELIPIETVPDEHEEDDRP